MFCIYYYSIVNTGILWSSIPANFRLDIATINLANINITSHSSTLYFVLQSLKLWTSTFKVTVQHSTLSVNIHVNISTMILTRGLSEKDEVWISKSNVELRKAHQSRQNSTWKFDFQVDKLTWNVTWQYPCLAMNIAIADDVIMFTMTRFNFSKLVCLVVKSAGTVPIPPKISSKRFQGRDGEFCKALAA